MQLTVAGAVCNKCGDAKPLTEFYVSELGAGQRCKTCFRARVGNANRRKGRQSMSWSLAESRWLLRLLRRLPTSELCSYASRPEYATVFRKVIAMEKRGTADAGASRCRCGEEVDHPLHGLCDDCFHAAANALVDATELESA